MIDSKVMLMAKEAFASRKAAPEWFADAAPCFERFAAMVAEAERERCAKACERVRDSLRLPAAHGADKCADLIRALKDEVIE